MTGNPLELFSKFFGAVRAIFVGFGVLFWLPTLTLQSSLFSFSSLFLFCGFPCFFCVFLLSFLSFSRVLQRGKSLLFFGGSSRFFFAKKKLGGSEGQGRHDLQSSGLLGQKSPDVHKLLSVELPVARKLLHFKAWSLRVWPCLGVPMWAQRRCWLLVCVYVFTLFFLHAVNDSIWSDLAAQWRLHVSRILSSESMSFTC